MRISNKKLDQSEFLCRVKAFVFAHLGSDTLFESVEIDEEYLDITFRTIRSLDLMDVSELVESLHADCETLSTKVDEQQRVWYILRCQPAYLEKPLFESSINLLLEEESVPVVDMETDLSEAPVSKCPMGAKLG